ncbi:MAG: hypothetical protein ABI861_14420 [Panacibacter sp.]
MELQPEQIREQQKLSWNKFSPGWKKWDERRLYDLLIFYKTIRVKKITSSLHFEL